MTLVKAGDPAFSFLNGKPMIANEKTVHNAQIPLLSLPAEIKIKIYKYVVGNSTLHCSRARSYFSEPSDITSIQCKRADINDDIYERCALCADPDYIKDHYVKLEDTPQRIVLTIPSPCSSRRNFVDRTDPMPLSNVCQQMYHEAALLPLEMTTFSFGCPRTLRCFVQMLEPIQQRAIRKITLMNACQDSDTMIASWDFLSRLTRLSEFSHHQIIECTSDDDELLGEGILQVLENLPLKKVTIRTATDLQSVPASTTEMIRARTREIEQRLLRGRSRENVREDLAAGSIA